MADNRALMAAFQKVRADVDQALEQTRRKEEAARAAEEAKRAQERREKRQGSAAAKQSGKASAGEANSARESKSEQSMVKAARVTPLQASSSAAKQASARVSENTAVRAPRTYSPKGAFGAVLAGAAQASGAVFRESPALQGESAGKRSKAPLTNKADLQIKPCRTANAKSCIPVLRAPLQRRRMQDIERIVPGEQIGPCKQRQDGRQKLTVVKIVSCGLVVPICPRAVRYELKMDVKTRVLSVEDDRSVQLVRNSPGPNAVIPFRLLNSCRGCRFLNAQPMLSRRLKRIKSSSSAVKRGRVKRRSSRRSA